MFILRNSKVQRTTGSYTVTLPKVWVDNLEELPKEVQFIMDENKNLKLRAVF